MDIWFRTKRALFSSNAEHESYNERLRCSRPGGARGSGCARLTDPVLPLRHFVVPHVAQVLYDVTLQTRLQQLGTHMSFSAIVFRQ